MKKVFPWVLAVIFSIVCIVTVNDYGINWDEPARLLRGQAFVQYFLTGSPLAYLPDRIPPNLIHPKEYVTRYDFLAAEGSNKAILPGISRPQAEFADMVKSLGRRVSFYQHDVWAAYFMKYDSFEAGHLPLPEILASFSNRFFYQALGVMSDIESYHIPYILLSAVGVFVVTAFTFDLTASWGAAGIAGLSLMLFPVYFSSAHFNLKDPEVASLFAGCVWMFWLWVKENRTRWMVGFWIFFALSLAVKWNTAFLPVIAIPWLLSIRKTPEFHRWFQPKKLIISSIAAALVCIGFLLLIWPVSWGQPVRAILDVMKFYWLVGVGDMSKLQPDGFILPFGFNAYPLILLMSQTPEVILFLSVAALFSTEKKNRLLILLWILVPIIRYSLPVAHTYGDWSQIMEVVPALAVLSGVGAAYLLKTRHAILQRMIVIIIGILFLIVTIDMIHIHPNENVYFNHIVGGIRGAARNNLIDYYITGGNVFKQGALWLNAHGEKNANIAILSGLTFALPPLWLRPDIAVSPDYFSAFDRRGEYIFMLPGSTNKPFFAYAYVKQFLRPMHEITVDGVPILSIYKNDSEHVNKEYSGEMKTAEFTKEYVTAGSGDYLSIDLGRDVRVTAVELTHLPEACHKANTFAALEEVITLRPAVPGREYRRDDHTYGIMEKKEVSADHIRYLFPGDSARYITVYPKSLFSCFAGGTVSNIYILP